MDADITERVEEPTGWVSPTVIVPNERQNDIRKVVQPIPSVANKSDDITRHNRIQ